MTMTPKHIRPKTVAGYAEAVSKEARKKFREIRACIRSAAPGAKESLKWGMPAFSYRRILVMYAAFKRHIGFYPTPSVVKAFAKDIAKFDSGRGSIRFPLDKPLPFSLIRRMVAFRVRESIREDGKWRT